MLSKLELAQYLVNLHTLLEAQTATGGLNKSQVLLDEYTHNWGLLKTAIIEDNVEEIEK